MDHDATYTFGELLKAFRLRQRMTQQQLAGSLGLHRNTISGWERGDYLPINRGIVLLMARGLRLSNQEARRFLEASLLALAPDCYLPVLRNPFFTAREEILETLHRCLDPAQAAGAGSYALHGLAGLGKTQVATEYAYRYALEYRAVFWLAARSVEHIVDSFLHIARALDLPEQQEAPQVVLAVQHWLAVHSNWLLIWDNLEDLTLLQRFLPAARPGTILITTRLQALGMFACALKLLPLTPEEGALLLLRRARLLPLAGCSPTAPSVAPTEQAAAQALATTMGGLPLALDQAGAYIEETGCRVTDYLRRYEQQRTQLLARRGAVAGDHPQSVLATFTVASRCVEQNHPLAGDLLRICAFLHPVALPEELFVGSGLALTTDLYHLDLAIAALRTFSLVQRDAQTHTFSLHCLVQAVLQAEMDEQERLRWQQRAIHLLNACFPPVSYNVWPQCERLLPHVLACAAGLADHLADQQLAEILQKAADFLRERACYEQAEPLYLRALSIREPASGAERLPLAFLLNNLAILYTHRGKYQQAEQFYLRALGIREDVYGPDHLRLANPLNNLANLYQEQGKYQQAEQLYLRALRIREQHLGPDHLALANPLNNLARLSQEQGQYRQAEDLYQRTLRIREQSLGPEHPEVARPLHNLADLAQEQGQYQRAEDLYRRALHIWEQSLGPDHPEVTFPLNGLATLYRAQGQYQQAWPLYQRALALRTQRLGACHPETAQTLHDLAICAREQGRLNEAASYFTQALAIRTQVLGDAHPKTVATQAASAALFESLERTRGGGNA
ncbi:MAG TPA: tetratricopeptide repeat protein [Ktedonobacteraceae bacterium]|jgi:tetratricopeptide (TPR) repeat protein/DNA-binding XRE family transcriptional regulator